MLRRPLLSGPLRTYALRRLASTTSQSSSSSSLFNSSPPLPSNNASSQPKNTNASARKNTIVEVIDPATQQTLTLDLDKVEPFSDEFRLLLQRHRNYVEQKHLYKTLRERQDTAHTAELKKTDLTEMFEPDEELVQFYVTELLRNRKLKTEEPPSEEELRKLIKMARQKAIKAERKRVSSASQKMEDNTLSFEEQWRRRQAYGENILKPMTPGHIARYNPHRDLKAPVRPRNVTMEQLLAAGCHLGHNKSSCHPAMKPFITGLHEKTHIINLDYTLAHLRRACTIVREVAFRQGIILIIGTRKGHKPILISATERMGACILFRKWIPGTVTNGNNVLFRGMLKEEPTPFKQYADFGLKERLLEDPLGEPYKMERWVFDPVKKDWVEADDDVPVFRYWRGEPRVPPEPKQFWGPNDSSGRFKSLPSASGSSVPSNGPLSTSMAQRARERGDLADWMAWEKFASIVQSISDITTDFLLPPQQALPPGLSEYIPDHSDNWYKRQLEAEIADTQRRHALEAETGDRNPLEMYEMDKFLARKGYSGTVRGKYVFDRVQAFKEDGLRGYPKVRVFRDGSTMVGQRRFTSTGEPLTRYSDGSYLYNRQVFDSEGKRYDPKQDSLMFSDGSQLRFAGEGEDRKLVVIIGDNEFDVTSAVVGSAEKREILEKANDLFQQAMGMESRKWTPKDERIENIFGVPPESINFQVKAMKTIEEIEAEDEITFSGLDEFIGDAKETSMKGSELLEVADKAEAEELDKLVAKSNRMTDTQEDLAGVEPDEPSPPSPFDNMYAKSRSTIRPDLIILLNPRENRLAVREATNNQIPTIGIIDTDSDPRWVTYSIPANDDSLRSVEYIMGVLSRAGEEGIIHYNRFSEQLQNLQNRARDVLRDSQADYEALTRDPGESPIYQGDDRSVGSVIEKYCEWYGLDPQTTDLGTITQVVANHIVLAQNEIKRLNKDTTGWSMQEFLDHVKTSTKFPGLPDTQLEEMATLRMRLSRETYYEEKEKPAQRRAAQAEEEQRLKTDLLKTVEGRLSIIMRARGRMWNELEALKKKIRANQVEGDQAQV